MPPPCSMPKNTVFFKKRQYLPCSFFRECCAVRFKLAVGKRQFECCAFDMVGQNIRIVGIKTRSLLGTRKKIIRMSHDVLVQRRSRGDADGKRFGLPPSRPSRLLPERRKGSGEAGNDCSVEPADIDTQFKRIRRNNTLYAPVPQALLDFSALQR